MIFDQILTRAAMLVLAAALGWALLLLLCVLVEAATGGRRRATRLTGCPERWRMVLVGAAIVALGAFPAAASDSSAGTAPAGTGGRATGRLLDGLPLPDRAPGNGVGPAARPGHRLGRALGGDRPDRHLVRAGDSLWRIARTHLGADADTSSVAAYVGLVHAANRDLIGADPDLIHPGQELRLPAPEPRTP